MNRPQGGKRMRHPRPPPCHAHFPYQAALRAVVPAMPLTIASPFHSGLIIRRSPCIGCVQPMTDRASAQQVVNDWKAQHPGACGAGVRSGIRTRFHPWPPPSAASCALLNTDIARFTAIPFPIPARRHPHHALEHGDEGADVVVAQVQRNRRHGLAGGQ